MKKLHLFCLSIALACNGILLQAQTNTFPSSGGVGIGTTSPNYHLTIFDSTIPRIQLVNTDTGQNSTDGFQAYVVGIDAVVLNKEAGSLYFATDNAYRMMIDPSGNVGIGTASPEGKLHIETSANRGVVLYTPTAAAGISDFATGGIGWSFSRPDDGSFTESIYSYNSTGAAKNNLAISSRSDIVFTAGNSGPSGAPERLRISETGNVGIGTMSPGTKLHVENNGNVRISLRDASNATGKYFQLEQDADTVYFDDAGVKAIMVMGLSSGNVGIGTTSPTHKLSVNGTIRAKEVIVDTGWADYVFAKDYRLTPLSEVAQHIEREGHLPGIPSAAEVAAGGVSLGDMQTRLLAKIEELTLHQIAQNKRLDEQAGRIFALEKENAALRAHKSSNSYFP